MAVLYLPVAAAAAALALAAAANGPAVEAALTIMVAQVLHSLRKRAEPMHHVVPFL
jgi:hypothetical protein